MPVARPVNLNDTTPPAPAGFTNVKWQADDLNPRNVSAYANVQSIGGVEVKTASYAALAGDYGRLISFNTTSAATLTLPNPPPSTGWAIFVQNTNTGVLTVSPNGLQLDNAAGSLTLYQGQGVYIATDGTNYFTEGNVGQPYDVVCTWIGTIPVGTAGALNQLIAVFTFVRPVTFLANLAGSRGTCGFNPTGAVTLTMHQNGGAAGTVGISTGGIFTFTASALSWVAGDRMELYGPADATLADIGITFAGRR